NRHRRLRSDLRRARDRAPRRDRGAGRRRRVGGRPALHRARRGSSLPRPAAIGPFHPCRFRPWRRAGSPNLLPEAIVSGSSALGFTPAVLLAVGLLFLVVSLSYAEGTAAIPETGGAATFVRRAFNDLAGFLTGWALFLDYLIVIALSALFLPHYLAAAFESHG